MKTFNVISNRDQMLVEPHLSAAQDPENRAGIICAGLNKQGMGTNWIGPKQALNGRPIGAVGDWNILTPMPHSRNGDVMRFWRMNGRAKNAWIPGGAQLDRLPEAVADRLIEVAFMSIDKLQAVFGWYDLERALRKLWLLNPGIVVVATNHQQAIALADGVIYRQPAFRIENRAYAEGEGKREAFVAGFFPTWLRTGNIQRALITGHANGAAVAASWQATDALLDRAELDAAVDRVMNRPALQQVPPLAAAASWLVSGIAGLFK